MNGRLFLTGLLVLVLAGGMLCGGYVLLEPDEYDYEYTVKAEQVNEDEMVDEAIDYDNVSSAEQEVLFDAFKKSDHFLGGAEADIETDEPIENISNEWRVIEIQGVPMLVAIEGPVKVPADPETGKGLLGLSLVVLSIIVGFFAAMMTKDGLQGKEY